MKLNHIDLQVPDVQETAQFFERHFAFKLLTAPTAKNIAVLHDEEGFSLVLQKSKRQDEVYPEGFHIGFVLDDVEQVYSMFNRLKGEGVQVGEVLVNNRGTMFYFKIPGDVLVEISANKKM